MTALTLVLGLSAATATGAEFADALMKEGDYYRAITEYKRELFFSTDPSTKQRCLLYIARAYRKSARYASAVPYAASLAEDTTAVNDVRSAALLELGLIYVDWGRAALAASCFERAVADDSTGFARLGLGLVDMQEDRPARAAAAFRQIALTRGDSASRVDLLHLASDTEAMAATPRLSPALATTLSFFVPGSGQMYSGHLYDGLQAFAFVGAFALATVASYQYEHRVRHHLGWTYAGISVTALFHGANLIGANRTAHYRNWKRRLDFDRAVRSRVLRYEPRDVR